MTAPTPPPHQRTSVAMEYSEHGWVASVRYVYPRGPDDRVCVGAGSPDPQSAIISLVDYLFRELETAGDDR